MQAHVLIELTRWPTQFHLDRELNSEIPQLNLKSWKSWFLSWSTWQFFEIVQNSDIWVDQLDNFPVLVCTVYRPCGADILCIVFTVPAGLICCVYRPCGADILCLPSLRDRYIWYIVVYKVHCPWLVDMICCVYRPCGADVLDVYCVYCP